MRLRWSSSSGSGVPTASRSRTTSLGCRSPSRTRCSKADFGRTALYDELGRLGVHVDAGSERMTAMIPESGIASLLGLDACAATLFIERRATASGQPVEWRQTHVRGDRFTVETDWTSGSGLSLSMTGTTEPISTTLTSEGR